MDRVCDSQMFILGAEVTALEEEIAAFCGVKFAVGVSSGTDALLVALMALDIGPGDEVITPTYSFFATAGVVARLGATPVFVDIDADSFNIAAWQVEKKLTSRTKAGLPGHLFGPRAELDPSLAGGARRGIPGVEDAGQAIGAVDAKGRPAGPGGAVGGFSFFPRKNPAG